MAGATCPHPCGQIRHISGFCGGPRSAEHRHRDAVFQIKRIFEISCLKHGFLWNTAERIAQTGDRAAPVNQMILWPSEQNPAPERYKLLVLKRVVPGRAKWQEPLQQPQAGPKGEGHGCP
jgi:hypothetical protein